MFRFISCFGDTTVCLHEKFEQFRFENIAFHGNSLSNTMYATVLYLQIWLRHMCERQRTLKTFSLGNLSEQKCVVSTPNQSLS